jgi:hypothetical protein
MTRVKILGTVPFEEQYFFFRIPRFSGTVTAWMVDPTDKSIHAYVDMSPSPPSPPRRFFLHFFFFFFKKKMYLFSLFKYREKEKD